MPFKSRYNSDSTGEVSYGHNVVTSIVALAAQEIKGVSGLQGKGIRTETIAGTINVDVFIDVCIGVKCADVAFRVQENIKRSVETMTKYKVGVVNVNIMGVSFTEAGTEASIEVGASSTERVEKGEQR